MVFSLEWNEKYSLSIKFSGYCKNVPHYNENVYSKSVKR